MDIFLRYLADMSTLLHDEQDIAFGSANIQRYYTVQQLIAQLRQRAVKRQLNTAE